MAPHLKNAPKKLLHSHHPTFIMPRPRPTSRHQKLLTHEELAGGQRPVDRSHQPDQHTRLQVLLLREEVPMAFRAPMLLALSAVTLLSGCAAFRNYDSDLAQTNQQLASGNVDAALTLLEKNNTGTDKDLL